MERVEAKALPPVVGEFAPHSNCKQPPVAYRGQTPVRLVTGVCPLYDPSPGSDPGDGPTQGWCLRPSMNRYPSRSARTRVALKPAVLRAPRVALASAGTGPRTRPANPNPLPSMMTRRPPVRSTRYASLSNPVAALSE